MNAEAKLSQLLGSYEDKYELVLQLDKKNLNDMAQDLLTILNKEGLEHEDAAGFKLIHIVNKIVEHQDLESEYVGKCLIAILNSEQRDRHLKKHIYTTLNHSHISKEDFIVGLKFIYTSGIIFEYTDTELRPRPFWNEEISKLFELYLPQLKEYLIESRSNICDVIYNLITTFYKYSPSSLETGEFNTQFAKLINKLSPERISRLVRDKSKEIKQIHPDWAKSYYEAERLVLEISNNVVYNPNPRPY